jgi:hypothetical protein
MPHSRWAFIAVAATVSILFACATPNVEAAQKVVVYRGPVDWYAHRHTFATLQGIVNRDGPVLYLAEPFFYHPPVNQAWLDYYRQRKDFEYEEIGKFDDLIARFRPRLRGLVGFDDSPGPKMARDGKFFPIEEYLATSVGALTDMLPVPSKARAELSRRWGLPAPDEIELTDYRGRRTGVTVHGDLARYGFRSKAQAALWAVEKLLPCCSPDFFFNLDASGVDYAAQHYALCTNLQYTDDDAGEGLTEQQVLERILQCYRDRADKSRPYFWVIGLQPPERPGVMALSRYGGVNTMTNMGQNWSFHTRVAASRMMWHQSAAPARPPAALDTRYVAFIASECTTQKAAGDGMQHGAWLDPARGQVAINWGMCAAFARQAPAIVDYYYSTTTPNDYFVTGDICAGMGFAVPPLMPEDAWRAVLKDALPCWEAMGLSCIDIYANDGYYDGRKDWPQFADMCDTLGVRAVTAKDRVLSRGAWGDHGSVWGKRSRVFSAIHYPASPTPLSKEAMIDFLFEKIVKGEGPWGQRFCCIYLPIAASQAKVDAATTISVSPSGLLRLQQRFDTELPGKVRIVRMDEMAKALVLRQP